MHRDFLIIRRDDSRETTHVCLMSLPPCDSASECGGGRLLLSRDLVVSLPITQLRAKKFVVVVGRVLCRIGTFLKQTLRHRGPRAPRAVGTKTSRHDHTSLACR